MSRKLRIRTSTGIYHVMLRGINKQNIFFSEDDYRRMQEILQEAPFVRNLITGEIISDRLCTIYAYCILDNHVHILIREGEDTISDVMQRLEVKYAQYYNKKYERIGHLFQARFESEPVDNGEYFYTLLRYIHRNPVKAMEAQTPESYPYSSWNEYVDHPSNLLQVLKPEAKATVLKRYPLDELTIWVNLSSPNSNYSEEDLQKADNCLDMNRFPTPLSDREAFEVLGEVSGINNPEDFRQLDAPTQTYYLLQAISKGITLRQASRLGTLSYYQIRKAYNKKQHPENVEILSTTGPDPAVEENVEILSPAVAALQRAMERVLENDEQYRREQTLASANERIRRMEGLSKKTYHRMHLIAEYLSQHPDSKCQDIASHIDASAERTRILLVQLSNVNIVDIQGEARARTYSLHPNKTRR